MKTLLILPVLIIALLFSSCANQGGVVIVDDNCLLYKTVKENRVYYAGTCFGPEGKLDSLKFMWENFDGTKLRAIVNTKTKAYKLEYFVPDISNKNRGIWIAWSSKSGIMIGAPPLEVVEAIEKDVNIGSKDSLELLDQLYVQ